MAAFRTMAPTRSRRQRGVSMLIALIGLLLMTIGAVAMVRSFDTGSVLAGNLAFRRDAGHQGDRGVAAAQALLNDGLLATGTARERDDPASNYSAVRLATDAGGIPLVLLSESQFNTTGMKAGNDIVDKDSAVTIRYVIDRQCSTPGPFDPARCAASPPTPVSSLGGTHWLPKPDASADAVYRVTVRVDGPRSTQAFVQATFSP
jgi:Tfp pilus assembly protein PilX